MIISQKSRILLKGLSGAGIDFTVPVSDDFTDGTWVPTDLACREMGVNVADEKLFIRIGNNIHEIDLDGSGGGGGISQVNSDWNAASGVANILNKPTIPSALSDLTQDIGYIQNITGLITSDGTINVTGSGTSLDPYVLVSAVNGVQTTSLFAHPIGASAPTTGNEILTITQASNAVVSVDGTITIKDNATGIGYLLTLRGVSDLIGGTVTNRVAHLSAGDFNIGGNAIQVVSEVTGDVTRYFLQSSTGPLNLDITVSYTKTVI